jgi:hypothetical protein
MSCLPAGTTSAVLRFSLTLATHFPDFLALTEPWPRFRPANRIPDRVLDFLVASNVAFLGISTSAECLFLLSDDLNLSLQGNLMHNFPCSEQLRLRSRPN